MNRNDFNMLDSYLVYLDNGATTLKPKVLSETISDYYNNYSANAHRGDYDISLKVDTLYEKTRQLVKNFINAKQTKEIVFTSGATDSLNKIVNGFFKRYLKENDEVLITKSEHASNVLPWFELDKNKVKVNYIKLDENYKLTLENVKKAITENTKVISISHITNVVGDIRPIKEIVKYAHSKNILVVVDGAQSVPHIKTDVQDLDIDFLAFSAHKMCGPTGVGILYGKEQLLEKLYPTIVGGGMNASFSSENIRVYDDLPHRLEAGTPNIAGVIGFGKVIEYLNKIGIENIHNHEMKLRKKLISELKQIPNIIIYNEESESGIVTINYKDVFAQDLGTHYNAYGIAVRTGQHCAKLLPNHLKVPSVVRASFYFYNTKEEIDKFIEVTKKGSEYLDVYFR